MTNANELLEVLRRAEAQAPDPSQQTATRVWHAVESRIASSAPLPELDTDPLIGGTSAKAGATVLKFIGGSALAALVVSSVAIVHHDDPQTTHHDAVEMEPERNDPREVSPDPLDDIDLSAKQVEPEPTSPPIDESSPQQAADLPESRPRPSAKKKHTSASQMTQPKTPADERALAMRIRTQLKKGKWKQVLRLVAEHERDFPTGIFLEERLAAEARALCHRGNGDRGRKAASKFAKRWPRSVHLPALRQDCGEV